LAVDVRRGADIGVAEDALHRDRARAEHHQQRSVRVARVVEADRQDLSDRPELVVALRATAKVSVVRFFAVATARSAALVHVARDDLRTSERRPQDVHEHRVFRVLAAVGTARLIISGRSFRKKYFPDPIGRKRFWYQTGT
jgi:hypothetical protein